MGWSESNGRFYLPGECEVRTRVVHAITGAFQAGGFREAVLPTLVYADPGGVPGVGMPVEKAYRFLDRQGSLLMLRPDMTPVVARFAADLLGSSSLPLRLYYQGSVFRSEDPGDGKRNEFLQVGGEIIGADRDAAAAIQVVTLAAECLASAGVQGYQIGLGHQTALQDTLTALGCSPGTVGALRDCLSKRDFVAFGRLLQQTHLSRPSKALITRIVAQHDGRSALECLREMTHGDAVLASVAEISAVYEGLEQAGLGDHVYLDFGLSRPFDYYSGFVMEGYVPGAGLPVLGGGAYGFKLAGGTPVPAAGFALDIDLIADAALRTCDGAERTPQASGALSIALPAGRLLEETRGALESAGVECSPGPCSPRSLVFTGRGGVRVMVVRPSDVPSYVEQGVADLGVVGEDVLVESQRDVTEILDLDAGVCRLVVAAPRANESILIGPIVRPLRIATKYPVVAAGYFQRKGIRVEIVRLSGAIEVAPLTGLSDAIVDICSTGATLKDNGLVVLDDVLQVSARLIANRASLRLKRARIDEVVSALRDFLEPGRRSE
ncbi:MAG: ATP phosphoribosyltransferase [Bacillota bacterium]